MASQPQPEASTSYHIPKATNIATFVLDSSLPRESFTKLVQVDGLIPRLVQRLMEKHGAGDNVRGIVYSCGRGHISQKQLMKAAPSQHRNHISNR